MQEIPVMLSFDGKNPGLTVMVDTRHATTLCELVINIGRQLDSANFHTRNGHVEHYLEVKAELGRDCECQH